MPRICYYRQRSKFGLMAQDRKARIFVEIGVDRGDYAECILSTFPGEYVGIDPYQPYDEMPGSRLPDLIMASTVLAKYKERAKILHTTSEDAFNNFPWWMRDKVDFVYIDGSHTKGDVLQDMIRWWTILSPNGVLAGHDYVDSHPQVMQAVDEFTSTIRGIELCVTDLDPIPSWVITRV